MATIVNTMIEGLTSQMVQARLNTIDAKPFLFGVHFPVKRVNGFVWKTLTNQLSRPNVAADIHADNSTIVRKRRPIMESSKGDIPFISISRELSRSELKEYQTALAFARDDDATQLVQYWGADVDFCFNGVQAELEYIAWALASNAGKLAFNTTNNATFTNEFDLDYQVGVEQLFAPQGATWDDPACDIIKDLTDAVKQGKALGLNPKIAFMNLDTFYLVCSNEQIIKLCSPALVNAVGAPMTPDLTALNAMLARQAWLNGIQVVVVDQTITREDKMGNHTSGNPFKTGVVILAESPRLGTTQYDILAENNEMIIRAERAHTIIKKYGTAEPQAEITIGQADAVPVFDTAYRNIYMAVLS